MANIEKEELTRGDKISVIVLVVALIAGIISGILFL
jgi:hypothetical protein